MPADDSGLLRLPPSRRRGATRRSGAARQASNVFAINLTPLLDCVFLLLLFLIVATRFANPEGLLAGRLPARIAAALTGFEVPRTPIRIYLTASAGGQAVTRINDKSGPPVARADVPVEFAKLRDAGGNDERTPVYLSADDDASWDDVVNVYNAALAASFKRIYFVRS